MKRTRDNCIEQKCFCSEKRHSVKKIYNMLEICLEKKQIDIKPLRKRFFSHNIRSGSNLVQPVSSVEIRFDSAQNRFSPTPIPLRIRSMLIYCDFHPFCCRTEISVRYAVIAVNGSIFHKVRPQTIFLFIVIGCLENHF